MSTYTSTVVSKLDCLKFYTSVARLTKNNFICICATTSIFKLRLYLNSYILLFIGR